MLDTTKPAKKEPRLAVTLSHSHPVDGTTARQPELSTVDLPESRETGARPPTIAFPVSAIALDDHPRTSAWAGLSEAGQILTEAEAHLGRALTQAELRAVMEVHYDIYEPAWNFGRAGISDEWISGWGHGFALYDQQRERLCHPEPLYGIGLVYAERQAREGQQAPPTHASGVTVRFRHVLLQVQNAEEFWQGIYEGQFAALDAQPAWQWPPPSEGSHPLTSARLFDDLLDLFYETGNHGLDFVIGYLLGSCEGLLCGRTNPPVRVQAAEPCAETGHASASVSAVGNS